MYYIIIPPKKNKKIYIKKKKAKSKAKLKIVSKEIGLKCPHCEKTNSIKNGSYIRKIDNIKIQCYRCKSCKKKFSTQTNSETYKQHDPYVNGLVNATDLSANEVAEKLRINRKTVLRKRNKKTTQLAKKRVYKVYIRNLFEYRKIPDKFIKYFLDEEKI